jgi:formiminoglutamase
MYQAPTRDQWQGRTDTVDGASDHRWHQVLRLLDLSQPALDLTETPARKIALLGFCCDEGVRRNQGRTGAVEGPAAIRKALANLAVHFPEERLLLYDAGDVLCTQGNLEAAQKLLAAKVYRLLHHDYLPIVLGGGHETAYGHYQGIRQHLRENGGQRLGIVNFDAHFDLRSLANGINSGTPFRQMLEENPGFQGQFPYLCLGIQEASNTRALFETAAAHDVQFVPAENVNFRNLDHLQFRLTSFADQADALYVTLDLDVFAAAFAPGVSAPALNGILPDIALHLLRHLQATGKVVSWDVVELSPRLDLDNRTAKLAASLVYEVVKTQALGWKS